MIEPDESPATKIINNECWISVNLNLLVQKRAEILHLTLSEDEVDQLANEMRMHATLDFLFEEVDDCIMKYVDPDWRAAETSLSSPPDLILYDTIKGHGWELKVPRRTES